MINLKTLTVETEMGTEEVLSKLTWKTHQVNNLLFTQSNTLTANTNRPLIGRVDNIDNKFNLTRLRPFLQILYIPKLIVKGQIEKSGNKTNLVLEYRPGFLTTVFLVFLVYTVLQLIWQIFSSQNLQEIITWDGIRTLIILPAVVVLLIIWEYKKTTRTIFEIVGINNSI